MHVRRLIRRKFVEDLSEGERDRLHGHLRECVSCREEHDRIAALLQAAAGQVPDRRQTAEVRRAVLGTLDQPLGSAPVSPAAGWRRAFGLAPVFAACVLVVVSYGITRLRPTDNGAAIQLRGGSPALPLVDVQVLAVRESQGQVSTPRVVESGGPLHLDETVQFRYLSTDPGLRYLYLFGLDARLDPLDYFPRPGADRSIPVPPSDRMRTVERSIRLATRHLPGALQVYALFSARPLERREVHRRIADLRARGGGLPQGKLDFGESVAVVVRKFQVIENRSDAQ